MKLAHAAGGLAQAKELYQDRSHRAKELKAKGKKIIGYFCSFPPTEILTAAHLLPYRIIGKRDEPVTLANAYLEPNMCSYVRSCLDIGLKGSYDFLDGLIVPHTCDSIERIDRMWWHALKPRYVHFIELPHWIHTPASLAFLKAELQKFRKSIEEFAGQTISAHQLREAVELHNQTRDLVQKLFELRKEDPPLLSGTEVVQIMLATLSLPAEEANEMLKSILQEVKERRISIPRRTRVLIWGCELDDIAFTKLVEESGANVVMDDLCTGSRHYWNKVEITPDPMDGITARYLEKVTCPIMCRDRNGTHQEYVEETFSYLKAYAQEYQVKGVILYVLKRCDTFAFWVPDVRDYLQQAGFPVLWLEDDYDTTSLQQLKTRVQAFVEMIS